MVDLSPLLNSLRENWVVVVGIVVALLVVVLLVRIASRLRGDTHVPKLLKALPEDDYTLIEKVILFDGVGTTQLDYVVVSPYGVFVIDEKYYKGVINGSEHHIEWVQQISKQSRRLKNPLRENLNRLKILQAAIGLADEQIFSVVAFLGDARFKTPMPDNAAHRKTLVPYIRSFNEKLFTADECQSIIHSIQNLQTDQGINLSPEAKRRIGDNSEADQTSQDSVDNSATVVTKPRKTLKARKLTQPSRCPNCSAPMKLATAKSGQYKGQQFWACSNYPKCRTVFRKES